MKLKTNREDSNNRLTELLAAPGGFSNLQNVAAFGEQILEMPGISDIVDILSSIECNNYVKNYKFVISEAGYA